VGQFKYLGTTVINYEYIRRKIMRLNSDNANYQNLLSSLLLSENVRIRTHKAIILFAVMNACKTWSLTLREELRLLVFENRVLKRIFGPKTD
jgi:hypothetical protein